MDSGQYWDNKIIEWEDSIKGNRNVSFIERLAARFRKPLKIRMEMCLSLLKDFAKDKKILELGCGSGYFAFRLYNQSQPKKIIGIDISHNAIKRANIIAKDLKLSKKINFIEKDVNLADIPAADITVGLGFLDYLTDKEINDLFRNMKSKYFLFTFSEKKFSFLRLLHIIYLIIQKCPKHYYYKKNHLRALVGSKFSNVRMISNRRLSFGCIMHNLPV